MLPLRKRLEKSAKATGLRLDVLQQDYLLSWVLVAIYQHPHLSTSLIFKGGTALKKCYFGNYRFSEDLDFSAKEDLIESRSLYKALVEAIQMNEEKIREYTPLKLSISEYREK